MSIRIQVTSASGQQQQLQAPEGTVLMELLRDQSDGVEGVCGGCAACGTCHVHIDPAWLAALPACQPEESDLLAALDVVNGQSRLSCQLRLEAAMDGLALTVVPAEC
ncbi:2Fe-2S iron-sulfur cluster-binding protein [Oceanobacter mangrovi]|uniref:2Fe-2S iron-sulfur cluster-binding protein n=1 Tax=Oceanobacter mangrovi TaxID=2862510 RepID=UPI001C8DD712|nr:2Fe-2S iron-sulfur cluster-binding protein [Oceanobacter mangrovi]